MNEGPSADITRKRTRLVRAVEIRNHVLPLIRSRGEIRRKPFGQNFITTAIWACRRSGETVPWDAQRTEFDLFLFNLRTPFSNFLTGRNDPAPQNAAKLAAQAANPLLGYGLDVWRGFKVLSLQWEDNGRIDLISMRPGCWEAELLAMK